MRDLRGMLALLLVIGLAACGGGGGSSSGSTTTTRTISGALTGDLSAVSDVVATRTSDGTRYSAAITSTSRMTELSGNTATFSIGLPTGSSYSMAAVGPNGGTVAPIVFSSSSSSTSGVFDVSDNSSSDLHAGNVTIPSGASETSPKTAHSDDSPYHDNDHDNDGHDDYNDDDDDDDGYSDNDDDDDYDEHHNGHENDNDSNDDNDNNDNDHDSNDDNDNDHDSNDDNDSDHDRSI